jgi:hypothetical protein
MRGFRSEPVRLETRRVSTIRQADPLSGPAAHSICRTTWSLSPNPLCDVDQKATCPLHSTSMVIRVFILTATLAFPMPLGAAPPDGADPNSPLGIWYRSLKGPRLRSELLQRDGLPSRGQRVDRR